MDLKVVELFLVSDINRLEFSAGDIQIKIAFTLPLKGPDSIREVFKDYRKSNKEVSGEAFCKYIDDKREQGLWEHYAMTKEQYFSLTHEYGLT